MDDRQYLKARGWALDGDSCASGDNDHFIGLAMDGQLHSVPVKSAVAIQTARDAAEERRAWVQFAAALMATSDAQGMWTGTDAAQVGATADGMLTEYRARFSGPGSDAAKVARVREAIDLWRMDPQGRGWANAIQDALDGAPKGEG